MRSQATFNIPSIFACAPYIFLYDVQLLSAYTYSFQVEYACWTSSSLNIILYFANLSRPVRAPPLSRKKKWRLAIYPFSYCAKNFAKIEEKYIIISWRETSSGISNGVKWRKERFLKFQLGGNTMGLFSISTQSSSSSHEMKRHSASYGSNEIGKKVKRRKRRRETRRRTRNDEAS